MKTLLNILALAVLFHFGVAAQSTQLFAIQTYPLEITTGKTVNLIFPYPIKSVDRGSEHILVQKISGAENILQVKAASTEFEPTNITVVSSDGQLFSFLAEYAADPLQLNIQIVSDAGPSVKLEGILSENWLSAASSQAKQMSNLGFKRRSRNGRAVLSLRDVYVKSDVLFFDFILYNGSNISFETESLNFSIADKKTAKRGAVQSASLATIYQEGIGVPVGSGQQQRFVLALSKFTIPAKKYLSARMTEKNGSRHIDFKIPGRYLINAKRLD